MLAWRQAGDLLEAAGEMRLICEAAGDSHLAQLQRRIFHQDYRLLNSIGEHILHRCLAQRFLEDPAEMRRAHACSTCQVVNRYGFLDIVTYECQNAAKVIGCKAC